MANITNYRDLVLTSSPGRVNYSNQARKHALVQVYKWSSTVPTSAPQGTTQYNWGANGANVGYTGQDGWSPVIPDNPGTDNVRLYTAQVSLAAPVGTEVSEVEYTNSHIAALTSNGSSGEAGTSVATVYAYQRSAQAPVGSPGQVEYDFTLAKVLTTPLQNNWLPNMPEGDGNLWVAVASASGKGARDFIEANEWSEAVLLAPDGDIYSVHVESTNGDRFKVGQTTTTILKARVFRNGEEVTAELAPSQFKWIRTSFYPAPPPNDDAAWNANYQSGFKEITVTFNDVSTRATFTCEIST